MWYRDKLDRFITALECISLRKKRIRSNWLVNTMRRKEPGHQLPWSWPAISEYCGFSASGMNKFKSGEKHQIHFTDYTLITSMNHISPWWRHQMETFSVLLALCEGNHRSPLDSLHKSQWRGDLMFSLICAWTNGWADNRDAGDLRRHRAHFDVTVIFICCHEGMCPCNMMFSNTYVPVSYVPRTYVR